MPRGRTTRLLGAVRVMRLFATLASQSRVSVTRACEAAAEDELTPACPTVPMSGTTAMRRRFEDACAPSGESERPGRLQSDWRV